MKYSNPDLPHDVNADPSGRADRRDVLVLGLVFAVGLIVLAGLAVGAGRLLGPLVPFSWELRMAPALPAATEPADRAVERRLQQLADRVAARMDLPPGMTVTLRYSNEPVVNAAATLGGQIVVFKGLLDRLDSENEVAALLAHEIGHVKHRHVMQSVGTQVVWGVVVGVLFGSDALGGLAGGANQVSALAFTRGMEREADREALAAQLALYGHAGGYMRLMERMGAASAGSDLPGWLRSHPSIAARIDAGRRAAHGAVTGPLSPWRTAD